MGCETGVESGICRITLEESVMFYCEVLFDTFGARGFVRILSYSVLLPGVDGRQAQLLMQNAKLEISIRIHLSGMSLTHRHRCDSATHARDLTQTNVGRSWTEEYLFAQPIWYLADPTHFTETRNDGSGIDKLGPSMIAMPPSMHDLVRESCIRGLRHDSQLDMQYNRHSLMFPAVSSALAPAHDSRTLRHLAPGALRLALGHVSVLEQNI